VLFDEEDKKRPGKGPKPLDKMSIEELEEYIQELKAEIVRVEKDIAKKKAHRDAASSIFKS
jgi:uncharacterized small protein (DUF1192 family)